MDRFIFFLIEHYYYSVPLLVAIVLLIRSSAKKGGKKITAQDLINLTNQNKVKLIDLRPAADFDGGVGVGGGGVGGEAPHQRHSPCGWCTIIHA